MTNQASSNKGTEKQAKKDIMEGGVLTPRQFTLVFVSLMVVILLVALVANLG